MKQQATTKKTKTYLAIAAHPDDIDFSCAGTIATLTAAGNRVVYCIITNGEKGTHAVKQTPDEMIAMREREQRESGAAVGVKEVMFLEQTDGDLEHTKEVRVLVTRAIRQIQPDVIISFDPGNQLFDNFGRFHRDHRLAAEIVFDAIYPAAGSDAYFCELEQENCPPHQIDEVWFYGTDRPNFYVDISKTIEQKLAALHAHASQIVDMKVLEKRIRDRARDTAKKSRKKTCRYAEALRRLSF
jgi:LmbE family N-acetylglucosaminyl deacetylase